MISLNSKRIATLTSAGFWGVDTLHDLLARHAAALPDTLALKDQPNRAELTGDAPLSLSWQDLDRASDYLALQLQLAGINEGDRVIVQLPNVVELALTYFAFSKLGAIVSPVPIQYGSHELQSMASTLDAKAILTIERFRQTELAANAREALSQIQVLVFGKDLQVNTSGDQPFTSGPESNANRVLTVVWTSGTTGTPKGVPRTHNMWLASARAAAEVSRLSPQDRLLCPFPLVNMAAVGGILIPALLQGCSLVLHHPLDADLLLQQVQDDKISFTVAPPALLNQLAKSQAMWSQYDLSSLRAVGSGSAPLSPWMIETFHKDFGVDVINMYGSNEGIALYSTPETTPDTATRATHFQRPEAGGFFETKVTDPETGVDVVAIGERGELLVSGATVFDGYLEHDNVDVFTADGFFRTGDLVEICGDNGEYYRMVGRCKDIINRGGMKISPVEIDLLLEGFPGSADAAVCPYPDERLAEKICACLVLSEGAETPELAVLQGWLLEQGLAKFKLPERIELFAALPRNPVGKVQRFALADSVLARTR